MISCEKDMKKIEKCDYQKYILLLACDIDTSGLNDIKIAQKNNA